MAQSCLRPGAGALTPALSRHHQAEALRSTAGVTRVARSPGPLKQTFRRQRRTTSAATSANDGLSSGEEERALRATVELDKLIDKLRATDSRELPQVVAENIFSFDTKFWLRLAARADISSSPEDKRGFESMSRSIMVIVERLVRKTEEQMDASSGKLADLLAAALGTGGSGGQEILWPPEDPAVVERLREEISRRDQAGLLDDGFLASLTAQLRQASERSDRPGLVAMLQKVLQLYAATRLGKRTYAVRADGSVDEAERLLESMLLGEVEEWDACLRAGLALGGGQVSEEALFKALELRSQRMLMRTESGSYEQRILGEYLAELEARARLAVEAFQKA